MSDLPVLVHPDGREYQPRSRPEFTTLVYSRGYRIRGEKTPDPPSTTRAQPKPATDN